MYVVNTAIGIDLESRTDIISRRDAADATICMVGIRGQAIWQAYIHCGWSTWMAGTSPELAVHALWLVAGQGEQQGLVALARICNGKEAL